MDDLPDDWVVKELFLREDDPWRHHAWGYTTERTIQEWMAERWRGLFSDAVFTWLTTTTNVAATKAVLEALYQASVPGTWEAPEQDALLRLSEALSFHQVTDWYAENPLLADVMLRRMPNELDEFGDYFWITADGWAEEALAAFANFSLRDLSGLGAPLLSRWAEEERRHTEAAHREAEVRRQQVAPLLRPLVEGVRAAAIADLGYPLPATELGHGP